MSEALYESLPDEIWGEVFTKISKLGDVLAAMLTCHRFHSICERYDFWARRLPSIEPQLLDIFTPELRHCYEKGELRNLPPKRFSFLVHHLPITSIGDALVKVKDLTPNSVRITLVQRPSPSQREQGGDSYYCVPYRRTSLALLHNAEIKMRIYRRKYAMAVGFMTPLPDDLNEDAEHMSNFLGFYQGGSSQSIIFGADRVVRCSDIASDTEGWEDGELVYCSVMAKEEKGDYLISVGSDEMASEQAPKRDLRATCSLDDEVELFDPTL